MKDEDPSSTPRRWHVVVQSCSYQSEHLMLTADHELVDA